jgi:hypothetical protein
MAQSSTKVKPLFRMRATYDAVAMRALFKTAVNLVYPAPQEVTRPQLRPLLRQNLIDTPPVAPYRLSVVSVHRLVAREKQQVVVWMWKITRWDSLLPLVSG